MAGGYWEKGQNPYWNYDSDAALNDLQKRIAEGEAHSAKLENSRLRTQADSDRKAIQQHFDVAANTQANLNVKIKNHKEAFFKLAIRSNTFVRVLNEIMEKHPDMKDEVLDLIQEKRNECTASEYREKWWSWVKNTDIKIEHEYLNFPYEERELKK
ncbi:aromatic ring-cleaving dioxygenase [Pantoea agglomerans]|uniref:hypothetical protein n=1 Tax=Enterobacter agglomerans TaxID=549 RepID=UPI0015F9DDA7|nr:hypothetical protein [Pantoea agglomerans]MBA8867063.1 aromatic ring-cleaving dioxygenase [Pantoea agglomerans]MBA8894179.1 aromatic ring-cleaving dioxygenase [Pantoea agglomerans]